MSKVRFVGFGHIQPCFWEGVIEFNYSRLIQYEVLKKPVTFIHGDVVTILSPILKDIVGGMIL